MLKESYTAYESAKKNLQDMIRKLTDELAKKIEKTPKEGVTKISESPRIVTVRFSALDDVWSPEYYIPECQAEAVRTVLDKRHSPTLMRCSSSYEGGTLA